MSKRTETTIESVEELRRDLLQCLDVNHTASLREFAKEAFSVGDWKPSVTGDPWQAATGSLNRLLGGGGCTSTNRLAFRTVLDAWLSSGKVVAKPAASGRVQVVAVPVTLATVAEAVSAGCPDLSVGQVVTIAQSIHKALQV